MKKPINADFQRLEKKLNLINDKLDRLMEANGIELLKTPEVIKIEEDKKRKSRERQQAKILRREAIRKQINEYMDFRYGHGYRLQQEFNLLLVPSTSRIKEYLSSNNPKAFDGLKRKA